MVRKCGLHVLYPFCQNLPVLLSGSEILIVFFSTNLRTYKKYIFITCKLYMSVLCLYAEKVICENSSPPFFLLFYILPFCVSSFWYCFFCTTARLSPRLCCSFLLAISTERERSRCRYEKSRVFIFLFHVASITCKTSRSIRQSTFFPSRFTDDENGLCCCGHKIL